MLSTYHFFSVSAALSLREARAFLESRSIELLQLHMRLVVIVPKTPDFRLFGIQNLFGFEHFHAIVTEHYIHSSVIGGVRRGT
jgi:hypothetical protein